MKKLLKFILSVVLLIVASDLLFGLAANLYIDKFGLHGDYLPVEYAMKKCEDDVVAIGSSVVLNSFVPSVFEDSLGLASYNAGANSQTLPYFHTVFNCILQRHTPKLVLLGLRPDELSGNDIGRYQLLVPYYHRGYAEVDSVLEGKSAYEKYLLKSNLYRYNTIWFRIMLYHFIRGHEKGKKGFLGHSKPMFPPQMTISEGKEKVSEEKLRLFEDIVNQCDDKGIMLVVYFPPMYTRLTETPGTVKVVERICHEHGIPCYYDTQDSTFQSHQEWFYDNVHLVREGSFEYSKILVNRLGQWKAQ